ncbi:MAG: permease, partial [Paraburkholderia sp.]
MNTTRQTQPQPAASGWLIFLLVAVLGLFYVKWFPYYHRAFTAAATHSIGKSILMGTDASPPAPSLGAALGYAVAYGKAIWQAMVLGLLLGSAVQVLLPVQWIARVLGKTGFGSVAAGGLLAIP